jgi:hypothetical protein
MSRKQYSAAIWTAIGLLCLLLLCPCVQNVPGDGVPYWSTNSIKQIVLALHNYHDVHGHFPPAVIRDKNGRPLYSWRVAILPYVEQDNLYRAFKLDEPWDSEHNKSLIDRIPRVYAGVFDEPGLTRFQVLVGPGTAFERPGLTLADFPDGPGSTLLVVEAADPVPWSKPVDLEYTPSGPLPRLSTHGKPVRFLCWPLWWNKVFVAGFADGRVRFIRTSSDERQIRAIITRNGGEPVDVSELE